MAELPTFEALYDAAKAEMQSRKAELTDFVEGSALDAVAGAGAMLADEVGRVNADLFASLFFDTAVGAELTALALDRLGLARKTAVGSAGVVRWTRGSGVTAYGIPAGTRFRATVGDETITVSSTAGAVMLVGESELDIPCQAVGTGRETNAAAGTVTEILDTVVVDSDATCTNPEPFAGGDAAESDEAFRDRIKRYYGTLRRATVAALKTGALSVPGVSYVAVDESDIETSGIVYVYVGDPDARSNSTLADQVLDELENWRAAGVQVNVLGAAREEIELSLIVGIERGADQDAAGEAIRAGIVGYGDTLAPSVAARLSRIEKAAHDAVEQVVSVKVTSHTDDIEPAATQNAIRFTTDQISLTFTEV